MENLAVTLVQLNLIWEDKIANLNRMDEILSKGNIKTDVVILPEMFTTGFTMNPREFAESMNGTSVCRMMAAAQRNNCVVTGSIIIEEKNKYYNRLIWAQPDGMLQYYDKRHLFRPGYENEVYSKGNRPVVFTYKSWRIKPLICYDLRFPVWSRNRNDYDILLYVANFPEVRAHVWETLLMARAIENVCFTIGVNRVGTDINNLNHHGNSMIVNPKGIAEIKAPTNEEAVVTHLLERKNIDNLRNNFPAHRDADDFDIKID